MKKEIIENHSLKDIKISTIYSGIKKTQNYEDDLLLIELEKNSAVAGVFTQSLTSSASVNQCKKNLAKYKQPIARAILVNSGNANAFTGKLGEETVAKISEYLSEKLNCNINQIYTASTGVIGKQLDPDVVIRSIKSMQTLKNPDWIKAATAIKTTDTFPKVSKRFCKIEDAEIEIVGIAKGSGMIAPNMSTMLGFIFTNANISSDLLQKLIVSSNELSFNSITVDSDTSTSDTVLLVATRKAKHKLINKFNDKRILEFKKSLFSLMLELAELIVKDGEGASKFITIKVTGAKSKKSAKIIAFSIANSPLVKTAIAGEDANWGRIIMAVGKSGQPANRDRIKIYIGNEQVTKNGMVYENYSELRATKHLKQDNVFIGIDVGIGVSSATVYTCDLTHKYIDINADYRS